MRSKLFLPFSIDSLPLYSLLGIESFGHSSLRFEIQIMALFSTLWITSCKNGDIPENSMVSWVLNAFPYFWGGGVVNGCFIVFPPRLARLCQAFFFPWLSCKYSMAKLPHHYIVSRCHIIILLINNESHY